MGGIIAVLVVTAIFITTINCIEMRDDIKDLKKELAEIKEMMITTTTKVDSKEMRESYAELDKLHQE